MYSTIFSCLYCATCLLYIFYCMIGPARFIPLYTMVAFERRIASHRAGLLAEKFHQQDAIILNHHVHNCTSWMHLLLFAIICTVTPSIETST